MSSIARSASQPSRMTVDEPVNNGTAMHDSSPVAWAMGAGMYDRSSHRLPSQRDVRSGEATKLRVLWATPLAPEVVPDVQPTSAGASTSTWSTRTGDAVSVSSKDVHPGTDHVAQLERSVDGHDRTADRAHGPDAVGDDQRLPPVRQLPHHDVAGADAVGMQEAGEAGRLVDELAPGQLDVAVDDRHQVAELVAVAGHQRRQRHVDLVAGTAVELLQLGGRRGPGEKPFRAAPKDP